MTEADAREEKAKSLIEAGSSISANVSAAAIGTLLAGPAGTLAGATLGPVIQQLCVSVSSELYERVAGARTHARMGLVGAFAIERIKDKLEEGAVIRDDGFFNDDVVRPSGAELYEGILINAQDAYEERKLPHYGYLYANIAFRQDVTPGQAHHLVKIADRLTYRQLCLLQLFRGISQEIRNLSSTLRDTDYAGTAPSMELAAVLQEIHSLYREGLITMERPDRDAREVIVDIIAIIPRYISVWGPGYQLFNMMELQHIPTEDVKDLAQNLM